MEFASLLEKTARPESQALAAAFAFLQQPELAGLPDGWIALPHGARACVQRYCTRPAEGVDFEAHNRYYDIQYLVSGTERIYFAKRSELTETVPYQEEKDILFLAKPDTCSSVLLRSGDYAVFGPQDAHLPCCPEKECTPVVKIVVKVPVNFL